VAAMEKPQWPHAMVPSSMWRHVTFPALRVTQRSHGHNCSSLHLGHFN
jgi:hypothetical protein